jgi:GMP synthase (glutamine-hydrolysing)
VLSLLVHVTVSPTFTLISFGENPLAGLVEAPAGMVTLAPPDCAATECWDKFAVAKLTRVAANATTIAYNNVLCFADINLTNMIYFISASFYHIILGCKGRINQLATTTLVIDNLSPFTPNILDCLNKLQATYFCRKYFEVEHSNKGNNKQYDKAIISGRQRNSKEINVINSKIIKYCFENDIPILGICYGAEIMALTLGGSICRMDGHIHGMMSVNILKPNHLISYRKSVNVYESHRYCVSRLPEDFDSLGSSKYCRYEIFSHKRKKMFGTQFHPEKSGKDGFELLSKFMML